jgi:uncharacterized protein
LKKVVILGASPDADRYSYKAMHSLLKHGHQVILVSPKYEEIESHKVYKTLRDVTEKFDMITVYVNPNILSTMTDDIIKHNPEIIIFNPGTEDDDIADKLSEHGIIPVEACTLVLLSTDQFNDL